MLLDSEAGLTYNKLTNSILIDAIVVIALPPANILWRSFPFFRCCLVTGKLREAVANIALFIRSTHNFAACERMRMTRRFDSLRKLEIFEDHFF